MQVNAKKAVKKALKDQKEAEGRKLNLIVYNVDEHEKPEERMTDEDHKKWRETCQRSDRDVFLDATKTCQAAITPDNIQECKRNVVFDSTKTRGILVVLKSEDKKKSLFRNLHLLHQSQFLQFHFISRVGLICRKINCDTIYTRIQLIKTGLIWSAFSVSLLGLKWGLSQTV